MDELMGCTDILGSKRMGFDLSTSLLRFLRWDLGIT